MSGIIGNKIIRAYIKTHVARARARVKNFIPRDAVYYG